MANTIKMKQSAVASKVPTTGQLQLGEIAVNTYDGKLFIKKNVSGTETIVEIGAGGAGVTDGDKGDITVSGSGATWTIDAGVVGTSKLGGDITTAGKALLDDADAAAQRTTLGLGTMATANTSDYLALAGGTLTGTLIANDTNFTLRDNTDTTKQAQFELSGITTATTRTYTLPNLTGTLATTGSLTQTFSGTTTFSGTFTASGASVSLGTNTGASTTNVGNGATTSSFTKVVNIGNGHAGTGITTVNLLSSPGATARGELWIGSGSGATITSINGGTAVFSQQTSNAQTEVSVPITAHAGFLDYSQVTYDSKSKLISGADTAPTGMFFKADGTSVFILGDTNDRVYRYDMSTAWDISTAGAVASTSPSLAAQSTTLSGLTFSQDGTKMYVGSEATDLIYQYTLSTAWDVSTATYAAKSASLSVVATSPIGGIFFDITGSYCIYVVEAAIYSFSLSTAWDISTASTDRRNSGRLYFHGNSAGSYLCPTTGHLFYSATASTSIAIRKLWPNYRYDASLRHVGDYDGWAEGGFTANSETAIKAVWYNHGAKKFYCLGTTDKTIYQHSIGWDTSTSWDTVYNSKYLGLFQNLGYHHFEGGIWYNNVKLDSRIVPAGGTAGQTLRKTSGTDYAYSWSNLSISDLSGGTLSGQMVIDHAGATGDALRVTLSNASATGNAIVVEDATNPDSTPWLVDLNGNTIHGHTASLAACSAQTNTQLANGGKAQLHGTTTQLGTQLMSVWNATAGAAPAIVMAKSNGASPGTYTATTSGDILGFLSWQGADGTQFNRAADIRAVVNGTVSAGVVPGSLSFRVASTAGTLTERLLIANDGTTTLTGSLDASAGLKENGVALSAKYAAIGSGGTSSFVSMAKWGTD